MANYIEYIKVGSGESWPVRDKDALHKENGAMIENIAMADHLIRGLGTPTDGNDAVNKNYVDTNFAPAGYGLGRSAVSIASGDDLNNYKVGGWYQFTKGVANAPFDYGMMLIVHGSNYAYDTFQYAFSRHPSNNMALRQLFEGSWGPWEWINSPMLLGVEYRTTERWSGAPVYTQLVDLGTITASFYTTVSIPGISGLIRAIPNVGGTICGEVDASAGGDAGKFYFIAKKGTDLVQFYAPQAGSSVVGANLKAQIWYTK